MATREDEQGLQTPAVISPTRMLEGRMPALALHPRYAANCSDVRPVDGILKKRTGYSAFDVDIVGGTNLDGRIQGLCQSPFRPIPADDTNVWNDDIAILLQDGINSTYYVYDTSAGNWVSREQTENADYSQLSWCPAVNDGVEVVVLSDDKVPVQIWDANQSTAANKIAAISFDSDDATLAKVVRYFYDRLVMFNVSVAGKRDKKMVEWTGVGHVTDDDGGSSASNLILGRKGGYIVGAEQLGDDMTIYCEHEIIRMAYIGGTSIFRFDPMDTFNGLAAQNAIANLGDRHLFLAGDFTVKEYSGGQFCRPIGDPINSNIQAAINKTHYANSFFVLAKGLNEAWLFVPTSGAIPDTVYVIKYGGCVEEYAWYKYSMSAFAAMIYDNWYVLAGYDDAINNFDYSSANDDTSAIDGWYETIDFTNVEDPSEKIRHEGIRLEAKGNEDDTLTVEYSTTEGTASSWISVGSVTLTAAWGFHYLPFDSGYERKIRYRFRNASADETFELKWFQPVLLPGGKR